MKNVLIAVAVVILLLVSSVVIFSAASTQRIAFTFTGGYNTYDPVTNTSTSVPATANVKGNIRNASGFYLTPLTGTINIGGTEKQVNIKLLKQSEQIYHDESSYSDPIDPNYQYTFRYWYAPIQVNIEGDKLVGVVSWSRLETCYYSNCWSLGSSAISFYGLSGGKEVTVNMLGPQPFIS